ncbi:hypothetical protein [Glutamicibacter sp. NPDC087344]|uniref:hypothetical protein n=1 Tax=Glutamicibacter sp. NPDC087344 TaxID=3363994 RepID=UPI00381F5D93
MSRFRIPIIFPPFTINYLVGKQVRARLLRFVQISLPESGIPTGLASLQADKKKYPLAQSPSQEDGRGSIFLRQAETCHVLLSAKHPRPAAVIHSA